MAAGPVEPGAFTPCPWCGRDDELTVDEYPAGPPDDLTSFCVLCHECGIVGPSCGYEDEAIKLWNRRPLEAGRADAQAAPFAGKCVCSCTACMQRAQAAPVADAAETVLRAAAREIIANATEVVPGCKVGVMIGCRHCKAASLDGPNFDHQPQCPVTLLRTALNVDLRAAANPAPASPPSVGDARAEALREALEGGTAFPDLSRIGWLSALLAEDFEQHINWESVEDPEAWHTAIRESRDLVRLSREALAAAAGDGGE